VSDESLAAEFARARFGVWRSAIAAAEAKRLCAYALKRSAAGTIAPRTPSQPEGAGGDFIMDGLLSDMAPRVEQRTGVAVWPTYSYFRIYRHGDVLEKHVDRPACEISLTLCLGFVARGPWPIWIEGPLGAASAELNPGDALLYRGIECPHWRDRFEGDTAVQVFLHYVERAGRYAEWKFDKRPCLTRFASPRGNDDGRAS
jgi:hypothetical protein